MPMSCEATLHESEFQPMPNQDLSRKAFAGALTGLVLAALVAAPLMLFSEAPSPIEAQAFASMLDGTAPASSEATLESYAANH